MDKAVKTCFKCRETLPLDAFYKHKQMGDGHLNKCKECTKKDNKENRSANIEYYQEYDRKRASNPDRVEARYAYSKTDSGKASHRRSLEKWRELNRFRRLAHGKVSYALKTGRLNKLPCFVCGGTDVHAHHPDYSSPLDVMWLCPSCHKAAHAIAA